MNKRFFLFFFLIGVLLFSSNSSALTWYGNYTFVQMDYTNVAMINESNNFSGANNNFSGNSYFENIFGLDWTNVTILISQITDWNVFNATYDAFEDTNASSECAAGEYHDGGGNCIGLNVTIDDRVGEVFNSSQYYNKTDLDNTNEGWIAYNRSVDGYNVTMTVVY